MSKTSYVSICTILLAVVSPKTQSYQAPINAKSPIYSARCCDAIVYVITLSFSPLFPHLKTCSILLSCFLFSYKPLKRITRTVNRESFQCHPWQNSCRKNSISTSWNGYCNAHASLYMLISLSRDLVWLCTIILHKWVIDRLFGDTSSGQTVSSLSR